MAKMKDPSVITNQQIVNQGSVPVAQPQAMSVPSAPVGRQTARGFGAMLRPQKFLVR